MRSGLGVAVLAFTCGYAQAQSSDGRLTRDGMPALLGTMSVEAEPNFAGGQLDGCTVVYSVIARDWTYKQGEYIFVNGSFGVMTAKGNFATFLKVVLNDFDPLTLGLAPSAVASAYFVKDNTTTKNAIISSFPSEVPGSVFVVSSIDPTLTIIGEGLAHDKVAIAFARTKGGRDIPIVIDTSVVDTAANGQRTRSPTKAANDFLNCATELQRQTNK